MLYNIGAQHDLDCIWQSENGQQNNKIKNWKDLQQKVPKERQPMSFQLLSILESLGQRLRISRRRMRVSCLKLYRFIQHGALERQLWVHWTEGDTQALSSRGVSCYRIGAHHGRSWRHFQAYVRPHAMVHIVPWLERSEQLQKYRLLLNKLKQV